ncbi:MULTISPECIES: hypothetical protein [unclassified Synechococcus]|nr:MULTISPECIES: hypothetical protein [unclassified Synechococcus]MCT0245604.1 hypothetical protein [Synechococcus sp. CS-601]
MLRNRKPDSYFARPLLTSRDRINRHSGEAPPIRGLILLHPALERIPGDYANGMAFSEIEAQQL